MSGLIQAIAVSSIDQFDRTFEIPPGGVANFTPLEAKVVSGSILRVDLGSLWYDFHHTTVSLRGRGRVSSTRLTFLMPESPSESINGCRLEAGEMFVFAPGNTFEGLHQAEVRNHLVTVEVDHLAAFAEQRGLAIDPGNLQGCIRLQCAPPAIRRLVRWCRMLREGIRREEVVLDAAAARTRLHDALLESLCRVLLTARPIDAGREMASQERYSKAVRTVEALLDERSLKTPDIDALCAATGLPPRSLHHAFQQVLGVSPTRYLRLQRLLAVRRLLVAAEPEQVDVTTVAMQHGFWHLGRFSQYYKEFFGELPSATLRRKIA